MGRMRFIVAPPDRVTDDLLQQVYLSGLDRIPWPVRAIRSDNELVIDRAGSDSGNLHVPWPVEGFGPLMLATATLRERPEPYYLPLELARGKLSQVRNQLADWAMIGLDVPFVLRRQLQDAVRDFGNAVCVGCTDPKSIEFAERALRGAVEVGSNLAAAYTEQALAARRRLQNRPNLFLGSDLGSSPLEEFPASQFLQSFNAGCLPMAWRDVETGEGKFFWDVCDKQIQWCRDNKMTVCAGPLLPFDERAVPDWLHLGDGDFESIASFTSVYLREAVERYRGAVDYWIAVGKPNIGGILGLSEEEEVRLTAQAIQLVRAADPQAGLLVSFDQPWAEYLARRRRDFPPLQFADALLRASLGMTGIALELNVGYWPGGTFPRDLIEFSQLLDYWSLLGVPLFPILTFPSGAGPDPLAYRKAGTVDANVSATTHQEWIDHFVPLALAKPLVHGVLWNQLRDAEPHAFPHGGLFDLRRHPKPALRRLGSIRQAHLRDPGRA